MSTFSGLSTALSSLMAQRKALDVAGQNVANANTPGYTRQRAEMQSISATSGTALFSTPARTGNGVGVVDVSRLSDQFLDARLRSQTSQAAYTASVATTYARVESVVTEPSSTGVAAGLQAYWSAWQDVANAPDSAASRTALLGSGGTLATRIGDTYRALETQWDQARTDATALIAETGAAATSIADLNQQIRGVLTAGGSANELMDQRDLLITRLSGLVGATARPQEDGTVTVLVAGNPIVEGDRATAVALSGSAVMADAIAEPGPTPDAVRLSWANGTPLVLTGGSVAGVVASLQPASVGGSLASSVAAVNDLATQIATTVNAVHSGGTTLAAPPNDTGVDFFTVTAGMPPALGLRVAISDPDMVAAANGTAGAWDGSVADAISQLGAGTGSPDAAWRAFVVDVGVATAAASGRARVTESSRATAESLQLAQTSVDIDEELTSMLAYQRAYEGAARVVTAIDQMLDTLINRTGVVGR